MSNELSTSEVERAFNAIDAARDHAEKLRGHIDWLQEQLAQRDGQIERLRSENEELEERIDVLENPSD